MISPRRDGTPGGGGGGGSTGPGKLYVTNEATGTILRFDGALTSNGNLTPASVLSGLSGPQYLTIDTVNDRLYVVNQNAGTILVYDNASTKASGGNSQRSIGGLSAPSDLALDRTNDLLYVAQGTSILVFSGASAANGSPAPARTISPQVGGNAATATAIFLDTANNRLYLADSVNSAIDIFDNATALTGLVTANRSLSGANTGLSLPEGVQVDSIGRLIVANNNPASITIYPNAATVNGNITPSSTVSGSATTLLGPSQILITTGNELYVADGVQGEVAIFAGFNAASGNIAPNRSVFGSSTGLARSNNGTGPTTARGVTLDATR